MTHARCIKKARIKSYDNFLARTKVFPPPGGYHFLVETETALLKLDVANGSMIARPNAVQSVTGTAFLRHVPGKPGAYAVKHSQQDQKLVVDRENFRLLFGQDEDDFECYHHVKKAQLNGFSNFYSMAFFSTYAQKWFRLTESNTLVADTNEIAEAVQLILVPA